MPYPMPITDPDAAFVARLLEELHGVQSTPIPTGECESPDLDCLARDGSRFVCEVKTFNSDPNWPPADGKMHVRRDNGPDRIGRVIKKAHSQFGEYPRPWVLVLVNRARMLDQMDMQAAFEGRLGYVNPDGSIHHYDVSARRVAAGDIKKRKFDIDLYIWIDCTRGRHDAPEVFYRMHHPDGSGFAEAAFGLPHIPPPSSPDDDSPQV